MKAKVRRRNSSRRRRQNRNWMPLVLLLAGGVLLGAALIAYISAPAATASAEYHANDVAHEQPILAIHEMGEGPSIPFLPRNEAQPQIQMPETTYNFGIVGPQDMVEREFIVRNVGNAPLTISRAYTTCGCTTAEISASVIPPGKVATVRLIFDAGFHDTAGQTVRRGLIIENNDPAHAQAEIWVQATVRSR